MKYEESKGMETLNKEKKEIEIDFGRKGKYEVYLLDESHDGELTEVTEKPRFSINIHSCILLKEI